MLFWMCGGMSLPPMFVEDEDVAAGPFFLRRIMRGADLVVGAGPADGSASVAMVKAGDVLVCAAGGWRPAAWL